MRKSLLLLFALFLSVYGMAQSTISGTVKDTNGEALVGATVLVKGTTDGTNTDVNGNFSLRTSRGFPLTLTVSYIGFESQEIELSNASSSVQVALSEAALLGDEVVISASRRPEKIQDAPAAISVINAQKLSVSPQIDAARNLMYVPGVQVSQHSAGRINIEMRAATGLFGTATFPIMDYRSLVGPGIGTFQTDAAGINTIDLQRIEVVRGPGSALYGPGVTSGVIHFITKNPIDFPGTTVELMGGELNTFGATLRHAGRSDNKKFGYKINAHYKRGDEFTLDPNDATDAAQIGQMQTTVSQPQITNGVVDATKPLETLLTQDQLDEDGDGNPMQDFWWNASVNGTLEFRPQNDLSIFTSLGYNQASAVFYNSQGEGLAQAREFWGQARVQKGGLFGQFFFVDNDGGSRDNPTFLYRTGLRTPVARKQIEAQIQYNFDLPSFLNANITVGADYRLAINDTENLVYGRNEDDDDYRILGGYVQGKFALASKLDLVLAGRFDTFNFLEENPFAPRAALVFKPSPKHTFRASYNRSAAPPSGLEVNIDFPVNSPVPGLFDVWLAGQKDAHTFPNPMIDLTLPGAPDLPVGTPGLPLAIPYGAVSEGVLAQLGPGLMADPTTAPVAADIIAFLSNPANAPQGFTGSFAGFNVISGAAMSNELSPTVPARLNLVDAYEIGYKGLIGDKLSVTVDIYNQSVKGFTLFTVLAPTYALVGADVPGDLGAAVAAGITPFLTQEYMDLGFDANTAAAIAGGVAAVIGGAYSQGGASFDAAASPLYPIFGAVESDRVPQGDGITHVTAGYRSFGDARRDHWGTDIGLEFFANNDLTFFANYSWISQNEWIPGESNDDGVPFPVYLNTPKNKFRLGANLAPVEGWNASLSFQHDDEFFVDFGLYNGMAQARNLFDASVGYTFGNGILVSLSGNNIFDNKYRPFPNFPQIGRRILGTVRFTFGDDK